MLTRSPKLDRHDRALLALLQRDAGLTSDELAERVALSASAVHRRVQRLRTSGVIESRIAVLDPVKVDATATFVVGIEVERERRELIDSLRRWLRSEAQVQQAYYVTGSADYVLIITAADITAFDQFMTRLMVENSNVRRFTTNVVMTAIKRGLAIPVD